MLPHLPFYLSFICSFVSQYPLVCPVSRLILWSAVTSECQSEPLVLALILAVSVAAELLWIADGGERWLRAEGEAEVLSLESVDGTETCEEGDAVLKLYSVNVRLTGSSRGDKRVD